MPGAEATQSALCLEVADVCGDGHWRRHCSFERRLRHWSLDPQLLLRSRVREIHRFGRKGLSLILNLDKEGGAF